MRIGHIDVDVQATSPDGKHLVDEVLPTDASNHGLVDSLLLAGIGVADIEQHGPQIGRAHV